MVRDGVQRRGGRERQRFRCVAPDGSFHRFLGPSTRTRATENHCEECDNDIAAHQGPASPWRFEYLVREVSEALVALGRGMSYTDAARRARQAANRGREKPARQPTNGQTVAEWVADFVPVVAAPHTETAWPDQTLVLDATEFQWTNPRTGTSQQLFAVLAAWGYPSEGEPRLWRLAASPRDDGAAWQRFLAELPGTPQSVVSDRDYAIVGAVQRHWNNQVPGHLSEHHLWAKGLQALRRDGAARYSSTLNDLLGDALRSNAGWNAFRDLVLGDPALPSTQRWVRHWDKRLQAQTARRDQLPEHYSTGAIEAAIATTREVLERRAWTFRNLHRMNLLLELVRLRINRCDDPRAYASELRRHLTARNGAVPRRYRHITDPMRYDAQQQRYVRTSSLRR
ncbi:MAG: hypothetical protein R6T85_11460 [Egibacteraceae bacterium]